MVEEEDYEYLVFETKVEDGIAQQANGEGGDDEIGREPLFDLVRSEVLSVFKVRRVRGT